MKKKNQFSSSNDILELDPLYLNQAENLIAKVKSGIKQTVFIELDCAPNGALNAFYYRNGIESAKIIKNLTASFLDREDYYFLDQAIDKAKNANFETDFNLGEKIGLWEKITLADFTEKISWSKAFCIKFNNGLTRIYRPDWKNLPKYCGYSRRWSIIISIYQYPKDFWLQKNFKPLPDLNGVSRNGMIYRLVFLCDPKQEKPELIGGLWISRPGLKIYLDKKSTVGLISPPKN